MEVESVLSMVGGVGTNSYHANSHLQKKALDMGVKSVIRDAVMELCMEKRSDKINVADLGCSSGPNTLWIISEVVAAITESFKDKNHPLPDIHFFLNDLPGNDFNTLFRSITPFLCDQRRDDEVAPLFVSGVPGSFFGRILPKNSIHFVHSSYSLHYLSQVPSALQTEDGMLLNKRNIYLTETSPSIVIQSYKEQYGKDFILFLRSRAVELVFGGQMVLTITGRDQADPTRACSSYLWGSLAEALSDMVSDGLIREIDLEKFNLPFYASSLDEVADIVQYEGSFSLEKGQTFKIIWDPFIDVDSNNNDIEYDSKATGRNVASYMRAVAEPLLLQQFHEIDVDEVFERYAEKIAEVPREKGILVNVVITLKKIRC